jgi:hypothetical protein
VRNANGDVIAHYLPGFDVSDFTVTRWGEEPKPTHILVPTKRGEGTLNSVFLVLEANGKTVVQLEAPLGDLLNATKATPLRYGKGAEYFAVLQNRATSKRSMLVLYDKVGQIAYQEILGESCLGLVTLPQKNTEALLVGCDGKIWEYSPVLQTKSSLTSATR